MEKEANWILKEKYKGEITEEFKKDLERLEQGEPVDYIIGFVIFLGCKIDLSFRPLIPRMETEYWVEQAVHDMKQKRNIKCLDIFSGSGCIGIAVLKKIKDAKVDFAELDENLLKQIKINLGLNKIDKKRYRIIQSDIFDNIHGRYDYILANPPYVPSTRKLDKSVSSFEPHKALFGGKDGLDYIKVFLKEADNYLKKGGKIYLEIDSPQEKKIRELLKGRKYAFHKDQFGKTRYLILEK